jgi:hypothetical protein
MRQHGNTIVACDLFTVDTVWLRRLYVLFFVSIGTRRVEYVACTSNPNTAWMTQQARNLLMDLDDRRQRPPLPDPRPRHEVQPRLRRHLPQRRRRDRPDADPGAERERLRRTLGRQCAQGVPRPAPDHRPPSTRARPPRLHPPLQRATPTPSARSATAGSSLANRSSAHGDPPHTSGPTTRPPRQTPPRIRGRGMTIEFVHPTGRAHDSTDQNRPNRSGTELTHPARSVSPRAGTESPLPGARRSCSD